MSTEGSIINFPSTEKTTGKHKKNLTDYFPRDSDCKTKMVSKVIQVNLESCLSDDDLSCDLPSEKYWNLLAEKKRIQLEKALEENERLHKLKQNLLEQNVNYKNMLEEANSFIDVFTEVVRDTADDTGIDVGDSNDSSED